MCIHRTIQYLMVHCIPVKVKHHEYFLVPEKVLINLPYDEGGISNTNWYYENEG